MSREILSARAEQRVGQRVARQWLLESLVDCGFLSAVYRGTNEHAQRVAVAVLHPELAVDRAVCRGFREGPQLASRLRHPDVPRVFGEGETEDGLPLLLCELFEGESVAHLILRRPGKVPPAEALRIAVELLGILQVAHGVGLVHGALHPRRAIITEQGGVKLLGFGSGPVRALAARRLGLEHPPGWLEYSPPEVLAGAAPDERADQWSLAAILFALLTGDGPRAAGASTVRSLREVAPDAPPVLVSLLDRALAADPDRRFARAADLSHAIAAAAQHPDVAQLRSVFLRPRTRPSLAPGAPVRRTASGALTLPPLRASPVPPSGPSSRGAGISRPPPRPTVPDLAAIDGADATAHEAEELTEIFSLLEQCVSLRFAGGSVRNPRDALRRLHDRVLHALAMAPAGLVWSVEPWGFVAGSWDLWAPEGVIGTLPHRLYADGVRLLGLRPGVSELELEALIELFCAVAQGRLPPTEDTVTALWAADFAHVTHRAVELHRGGLPAAEQGRVAQLVRELRALATLDTSLQLEEQWRLARSARRSALPPDPRLSRPPVRVDRARRHEIAALLLADAGLAGGARGTALDRLTALLVREPAGQPQDAALARLVDRGELLLALDRLVDRVAAHGVGSAGAQDTAHTALALLNRVLGSGETLALEVVGGELWVGGELPAGPRSLQAAGRRLARVLLAAGVSQLHFDARASRGSLLQLADRLARAERSGEDRHSWPPQPGVSLVPLEPCSGTLGEAGRFLELVAETVAVWQVAGVGEARRSPPPELARAVTRSVRRLVLASGDYPERTLGLLPLGLALSGAHAHLVLATLLLLGLARWLDVPEAAYRALGLNCLRGQASRLQRVLVQLMGAADATPTDALERLCSSFPPDAWEPELLCGALGILPPGTPVEIDDGRWAVVLSRGGGVPAAPVVAVVVDASGRALDPHSTVDLHATPHRVTRCLARDEARFNTARPFFAEV